MIAERERVKDRRAAFVAGAAWYHDHLSDEGRIPRDTFAFDKRQQMRTEEAARRYPLPTITRPRVVRAMFGYEYRVVDGVLQVRTPHGSWGEVGHGWGDDIRAIVALLDNPTEEVEDTGDE